MDVVITGPAPGYLDTAEDLGLARAAIADAGRRIDAAMRTFIAKHGGDVNAPNLLAEAQRLVVALEAAADPTLDAGDAWDYAPCERPAPVDDVGAVEHAPCWACDYPNVDGECYRCGEAA